ncbi:hypothetical protein OG458_42345 (plasmid) [Streptomyces sp. NBC_01281]|uniref:hypothetical protein n=1 Tax=Streptomyces sp. NBC_01281 TaxID=2903811 RepID=UPI002E10434E|nr:hypothetical protein OG458_41460 [Streptomyces sp. NBC_01281]WSK66598.1 hypothetical protein OG458_42345 [Streptomyces sp. NBC_01281]
MTRLLCACLRVLLRIVAPLIRRGWPRLAVLGMTGTVCALALAVGQALGGVAAHLPAQAGPLAIIVVGVLGAAVRLAALAGLGTGVLLLPPLTAADVVSRGRRTR